VLNHVFAVSEIYLTITGAGFSRGRENTAFEQGKNRFDNLISEKDGYQLFVMAGISGVKVFIYW
jgi:hypothetical protein